MQDYSALMEAAEERTAANVLHFHRASFYKTQRLFGLIDRSGVLQMATIFPESINWKSFADFHAEYPTDMERIAKLQEMQTWLSDFCDPPPDDWESGDEYAPTRIGDHF